MVYIFMCGKEKMPSGSPPAMFPETLTSLVGSKGTVPIRFLLLGWIPGPGSWLRVAF